MADQENEGTATSRRRAVLMKISDTLLSENEPPENSATLENPTELDAHNKKLLTSLITVNQSDVTDASGLTLEEEKRFFLAEPSCVGNASVHSASKVQQVLGQRPRRKENYDMQLPIAVNIFFCSLKPFSEKRIPSIFCYSASSRFPPFFYRPLFPSRIFSPFSCCHYYIIFFSTV